MNERESSVLLFPSVTPGVCWGGGTWPLILLSGGDESPDSPLDIP